MIHKKKILILLGHPDRETLSGSLANTYQHAAEVAGHEVRRINIGELRFDPILHKGYKVIQELEPDLKRVQADMQWADHLVVLYPNWWCTMPALLKGLFDRLYLPGFAFRFRKSGFGWEELMRGKTARVIVTSASHPFFIWLLFGDYTNEIQRGILGFAGYRVRLTLLGPAEKLSTWRFSRWNQKMQRLGKRGM